MRYNPFKGHLPKYLKNILQGEKDPLSIREGNKPRRLLPKLGVYRNAETQAIYSPAVSRFSLNYYDGFKLEPVPFPNSFPFYVLIDKNSVETLNTVRPISQVANSNSGPEHRPPQKSEDKNGVITHLIDYEGESDYHVVYSLLSDLDKQILRIISEFRNVQHVQLLKELSYLSGSKVEKSIRRLHKLYLIEKHRFSRDALVDKGALESPTAFSYSIYSHGTMLLLKFGDIAPQYAYKWKEQLRREDDYAAIRYWKIFDTYLNLRVNRDFYGFVPYSYLKSFTYKEEVVNDNLSEQARTYLADRPDLGLAKSGVIRKVPWVRFDGQIITHNRETGQKTKFDLYPFITAEEVRSDLSKLGNVFRQYGDIGNKLDAEGYKRYLLIIVDSEEQIRIIEERYALTDGYKSLSNILFLDLETSSEDYGRSLKVMKQNTSGQRNLRTLKFTINPNILGD